MYDYSVGLIPVGSISGLIHINIICHWPYIGNDLIMYVWVLVYLNLSPAPVLRMTDIKYGLSHIFIEFKHCNTTMVRLYKLFYMQYHTQNKSSNPLLPSPRTTAIYAIANSNPANRQHRFSILLSFLVIVSQLYYPT